MFIAKRSITHFVEMRVMNGGLSEVGFVDPHDPTSAVPAISYCSHFICCNPPFVRHAFAVIYASQPTNSFSERVVTHTNRAAFVPPFLLNPTHPHVVSAPARLMQ